MYGVVYNVIFLADFLDGIKIYSSKNNVMFLNVFVVGVLKMDIPRIGSSFKLSQIYKITKTSTNHHCSISKIKKCLM